MGGLFVRGNTERRAIGLKGEIVAALPPVMRQPRGNALGAERRPCTVELNLTDEQYAALQTRKG